MVKSEYQIITSPFGPRIINGKKSFHRGVDIRTVDLQTRKDIPIVTSEQCKVLRQGIDPYGNYYLVVQLLESSFDELKYIHITETNFKIGSILITGTFIGYAIIGGNSKAKHLHFETWKNGEPVDPMEYCKEMKINCLTK